MSITFIKRITITLAAFFLNMVCFAASGEDLSRLSAEDKAQLTEFHRLKKRYGSLLWPGFGEASVPLIQYNEQFEFLIGHPNPPPAWTPVENDAYNGNPYYRRIITDPEAFAVPVGDSWAGSLDTLVHMNRSMKKQLKEKIPPEKLTPAMLRMMEVTSAYHIVALIHEAFHAYLATQEPKRFLEAQKMYALEKFYPFEDETFINGWNEEGSWLASAVRAQEEAKRLASIERFLDVRKKRRAASSLSDELIELERRLEWLEGLAKYVEIQFAELGSSQQGEAKSKDYQVVRNRLQADFSFRIRNLGSLDGDLRFYLSGAAQAMILDKVSLGWKKTIMNQSHIGLEDLLVDVLKSRSNGQPFSPESRITSEEY